MEKTQAKRFWQEVWKRYVEKQKYTKQGEIRKGFEERTDSFMVSSAIWDMSNKEFQEIIKKTREVRNSSHA